jgi:Bardet-Biedl syndrome 2 protein
MYFLRNQLSIAYFPAEMKTFHDALDKVNDYNETRTKLTAEMADSSNLIKTLVIKAEDARILNQMYHYLANSFAYCHYFSKVMKKMYNNLYELNQTLIGKISIRLRLEVNFVAGEYQKRRNNFGALLDELKFVNQIIQRHARLRVGTVKTRIVAYCRAAIKANNRQALFQIIKFGKETQ